MKGSGQILFAAFLIDIACVDQVDFGASSRSSELPIIVEGSFIEGEVPYVILSTGYRVDGGYHATRVQGALVSIINCDDSADAYALKSPPGIPGHIDDPGTRYNGTIYFASGPAKPKLGARYQLKIIMPGGQRLESVPQPVTPVGSVDQFHLEYVETFDRARNVREGGLNIYIDTTLPSADQRYMRWQLVGIYQHPDGCFIQEKEDSPLLSQSTDNREHFNHIFVKHVPVNKTKFYDRYYVEIVQESITQDAWKFHDAAKFQLEHANSIFQPPFGEFVGNVHAVDPGASALGIFTVSLSSRKSMFITLADLDNPLVGPPDNDRCDFYSHLIVSRPSFWP